MAVSRCRSGRDRPHGFVAARCSTSPASSCQRLCSHLIPIDALRMPACACDFDRNITQPPEDATNPITPPAKPTKIAFASRGWRRRGNGALTQAGRVQMGRPGLLSGWNRETAGTLAGKWAGMAGGARGMGTPGRGDLRVGPDGGRDDASDAEEYRQDRDEDPVLSVPRSRGSWFASLEHERPVERLVEDDHVHKHQSEHGDDRNRHPAPKGAGQALRGSARVASQYRRDAFDRGHGLTAKSEIAPWPTPRCPTFSLVAPSALISLQCLGDRVRRTRSRPSAGAVANEGAAW